MQCCKFETATNSYLIQLLISGSWWYPRQADGNPITDGGKSPVANYFHYVTFPMCHAIPATINNESINQNMHASAILSINDVVLCQKSENATTRLINIR